MATVSLRFDDDFKAELDEICEEMGMNLTTFFMVYAKKAVRDRRIPFEISAPRDVFFADCNIRKLSESIRQMNDGQTVTKTLEELEAVALG